MELVNYRCEHTDGRETTVHGRMAIADATTKDMVLILPGDGPVGKKKDTWVSLQEKLLADDISSLAIDFDGQGESEVPRSKLKLSVGMANARSSIDFLMHENPWEIRRVHLFGNSFGGNIAVLLSNEMPEISSLFLRAPVSDYTSIFLKELGDQMLEAWVDGNSDYDEFENQFYFEALKLSTYVAASNFTGKAKIVHGKLDEVVPYAQSIHLNNALKTKGNSTLELYEDCGHQFDIDHQQQRYEEACVDFFLEEIAK